jgi:thiamine pyrophosphokinase
MKALIVSGGQRPSRELIEKELADSDVVICADSGANCLYEYKIMPHILVGDFDSIDKKVFSFFETSHCKVERFPKEKDYTDTELAMCRAIEYGADEICFLGCTGSRIDHMMGNIGLLLKALNVKVNAKLKDDNNTLILTDKPLCIKGNKGMNFSLIAYGDNVSEVTIEGAKYPLHKYNLKLGEPIGISNEFLEEEVEITFTKGLLLIIYSVD